jgi:drug/metabolite transporter (DMT)-like permease
MAQKEDLSFATTLFRVNLGQLFLTLSASMNHLTTSRRGVSVLEYAVSRNFFNTVPILMVLLYRQDGWYKGFKSEHIGAFLARALIGVFGFFTMTWMYKLIPMGIGATITATNPII